MAQTGSFPTRTAAVTERMREDIVSLRLTPGSILRDNELAAHYGVSSSPIREALARMSAERLVDILPNKTKFVTPIDRRTVADFLEVHRILVRAGFALGTHKLAPAQVGQMRTLLAGLECAASAGDPAGFIQAARAFLDPVYLASGNAELRRQVGLHATWLRRMIAMLPSDYFADAVATYGRLLALLEAGDIDGACRCHDQILARLESMIMALDLPDPPETA